MNQHHSSQKASRRGWSLQGHRVSLMGLIMGVSLMLSGAATQAAPLGLTLADTPDIFSSFITVDYESATQRFRAFGVATTIDVPGVSAIDRGTFEVRGLIDNAGNLVMGTVTIMGTVASEGFNSGTLLTGDLTDFGFIDAGGDPLEFTFDVSGGDAAGVYGGIGSVAGIIMGFTGSTGDFTNNWSSAPNGAVADVAPVPLPAAAWLFGSALLGMAGVARKRAANAA